MGFNAAASRAFLVAENGNLEAAVRRLLDGETPPHTVAPRAMVPLPAAHPTVAAPPPSSSTPAATPPPPARGPSASSAVGLEALAPPPPSKQLNMVVIGHVDAGKSTLMGRLLLLAGQVDQRTMHKYEKESAQIGKASFKFAWVMDQSEEERSRGVTVDVGTAHFATANRLVNVLDAPGHRDFVPNMITGAAQADLALLVINAAPGEYESGLSGQTREHVTLARSVGVAKLIVAVNQMDAASWSQARYEQVRHGLTPMLVQLGYREPLFVPLSALAGENLAAGSLPPAGQEWYDGRALLDEIDAIEPAARPSVVGTRLAVADAFRTGGSLTLIGTVQAGTVEIGQRLLLLPAREVIVVKSLWSRGAPVAKGANATAGDHVQVGVGASLDASVVIGAGSVACDPQRPVPLARRIEVHLRALSGQLLTKGAPLELHAHSACCAATLRRFIATVDKKGEAVASAKPPRALRPKEMAIVELDLDREVCLEREADCKQLGRVVVRAEGETVGAGLIRAILK